MRGEKNATTEENMSYAWKQLHLAVRALASKGSQRDCLVNAYVTLMELKQRDLPADVRSDFSRLTQGISSYPADGLKQTIRNKVDLLVDTEVGTTIYAIIDLYGAVARYQPLPAVQAKARVE
jgi:hypothetical protein